MKYTFSIFILGLLLVGAGCATQDTDLESPISNLPEWYITFDYPGDWQAMQVYALQTVDFGEPIERSTARGHNRAWIQSIGEPVLPEGFTPRDNLAYTDEDWILVDVTAYPKPAKIPSTAELVERNRRTFGITRGGATDVYYFDSGERLYEMFVHTSSDTDPLEVVTTLREL